MYRRLLLCPVTLVLFLMVVAPALAEDRRSILPPDGTGAFERLYYAKKDRFGQINRANDGEKASKENPADLEAIDLAAKWNTYRITWDSIKMGGENKTVLLTDPGVANKLMVEFEQQVKSAEDVQKGNPVFTEMYLKALAVRARDVIQTSQPISALNGARMLARLAEAGSEDAGDACLDALKDQKEFLEPRARAGVQYYALQGLKHLLARWAQTPPTSKDRQTACVEVLVAIIERPLPPGTTFASREELEGVRVFRREAVRALAQFRSPALTDAAGKIRVRSAQTLLKVVNDDGLSPAARLDEQIEAAIGVARLQVKPVPAYQPDYAAQQIGGFVVEMARRARPAGENKTPWENKLPWKIHAARLGDALEGMRAEVKDLPSKPAAGYVDLVVVQALRALKEIEVSERANGGDLKFWLDSHPVPSTTLYKGLADSTVLPLDKSKAPASPEKPAGGESKPDVKKPDEKKPDEKKPGKP